MVVPKNNRLVLSVGVKNSDKLNAVKGKKLSLTYSTNTIIKGNKRLENV
jgi:hypothetical protein